MIQLRKYQIEGISNVEQSFREKKKSVLLQSATGSGKTVMFCEISRRVAEKGNKVLILTDRTELLFQTSGSLSKVGVNAFLIQAGIKYVSNAFNVYVAMSQTLRRRIEEKYWHDFFKSINLLIIDEAHKQEFNYIFESGLVENAYKIGFTATPKRSGKMRQLGLDYQKIIETISIKELIKQGYLVDCDVYKFESPDMSDVSIDYKTGDYSDKSMFQKFNSPKLYAGVVSNYKELVFGTKAIVFCCNIEHAIKTAIEFHENHIPVKFVVSTVSKPNKPDSSDTGAMARYEDRMITCDLLNDNKHLTGNRKEVFDWFSEGNGKVLVNAGIATTGYDCPAIETVILNRATISEALYLQMIGRGSRIFGAKTHFNILDFGGNVDRHGEYSEDRNWYLWHEEGKGGGVPPIKECGFDSKGVPIYGDGGCRRLILATYSICPFCGFRYPEKTVEEVELTLTYDKQRFKKVNQMNNRELFEYWKAKKHKSPWLWRQLWYRGRQKAIVEFGREYDWNHATISKAINFCKNF